MKKMIFFFLIACINANAQKELWGYRVIYNQVDPNNTGINDGEIIKVPLAGINSIPTVMHTFDVTGTNGKFPRGRLLQASNGKLYGITTSYIYDGPTGPVAQQGVLFEYDPVLSKYKVLSNALTGQQENEFGVIEAIPGILYGTTNNGNSIFKYSLATNTYSIAASIPTFIYLSSYTPKFKGELMKASDGLIYGVTDIAPSGPNNAVSFVGGIYRFNPSNNQITKMAVMGVPNPDVNTYYPIYGTKLIEGAPGRLYGTSYGGDHIGPDGVAVLGSGTIFEYTIATNTIAKKFDFDYNVNGTGPSVLVKGDSDKLYGTLVGLNGNTAYPNSYGSIFEYDYVNDTMVFRPLDPFIDNSVQGPAQSEFMFKASDNNLYGVGALGLFQYNPTTSAVMRKIDIDYSYNTHSVIEICRKPSYQEITVDTFDGCVGGNFTYDIQNTNATSYQWREDGVDVPGQTSAILNLTDLTPADAGSYTCVMTNECGTTTTMALQLTVNCLGTDTFADLDKSVKLYPNPATNVLHIELPKNIDVSINSCTITNLLGQTVYKAATATSIEVVHLQKGIYILSLQTNYGDWNGKFVKE